MTENEEPWLAPVAPCDGDACGCSSRPLRVLDNFQGWGNRIGWWLTACALAEALHRPAVITGWHGAPKTMGGRNYDYFTVRRLVRFPRTLRFVEDVVAENKNKTSSARVPAGAGTIAPPLSGGAFRAAYAATCRSRSQSRTSWAAAGRRFGGR